MATQADLLNLAMEYHRAIPERIRRYLNGRGIPDPVIDLHLLGWNGERITIPVFDRDGKLAFFKLAKDPEDPAAGPKMLTPAGTHAELYGWERVRVKPCRIVICEGEFDRLVLESQGIAAVTSTGGAGVFRQEWAKEFEPIPEVFVCFDRDEAGRNGARRVARLLSQAKLVELPDEVGEGGDVTDFLVRRVKGREEFLRLLQDARPLTREETSDPIGKGRAASGKGARDDVQYLKSRIGIEKLVGRYVSLRMRGENYVGRCPFHDDNDPSLVVYPKTQSFYCFGCRKHGDVVDFLREMEALSFGEALDVLRDLAA